jgi:hypothetical protein
VIGGPVTYATEQAAAEAEDETRRMLPRTPAPAWTVAEFWAEWTTDPLWLWIPRSHTVRSRAEEEI